jgi:hypothetical protein
MRRERGKPKPKRGGSMRETSAQGEAIAALEWRGFRLVNRLTDGTAIMQKLNGSFRRTQAEIDEDGCVNGVSVEEYIQGLSK